MTYARAGHTPLHLPARRRGADDRRVQILAPDGLVLGLKIDDGEMFERLLEEETMPLQTGDVCLFFTDGITEAMNGQDDCFGEERLGAADRGARGPAVRRAARARCCARSRRSSATRRSTTT